MAGDGGGLGCAPHLHGVPLSQLGVCKHWTGLTFDDLCRPLMTFVDL